MSQAIELKYLQKKKHPKNVTAVNYSWSTRYPHSKHNFHDEIQVPTSSTGRADYKIILWGSYKVTLISIRLEEVASRPLDNRCERTVISAFNCIFHKRNIKAK